MEGLGGAPALLSPNSLRLCFVTRSQALALEPLEAQLLRESAQDSEAAAPSPALRPSILAGAFVRVRFDSHRLDRVEATQLRGDGRIAVRLQATGRCVPLASLSRGSPLEDPAAWEQELAALQGALAEQPPTCWEIAAACCRLSRAWKWAQEPAEFAAALQRGLPALAAQLEDAAAVQGVLGCVEPAAPAAAPEPSAAVAAEQFLAAMVPQPVAPAAAAEPTAVGQAAAPGVPTPAQPVPLVAAMPAEPAAATAAPAPAAAAPAGDGSFFFEAPGSGRNWEAPSEQYQRVVTFVPDDADMEQQRQKRGREERSSPPAKRQRSEASPVAARSADRLPGCSLAEHKRRQIEEDMPPGSRREALLVRAVERSCLRGEERQGGDLGNALAALDSDWKARLGGHSITDLLLAMNERGLVRAEVRKDAKSSGRNVYYSRASARPPPPAAKRADSRQLAVDVPPGSRREALLVRAVEQSCPPNQERQAGILCSALTALDSDWEARLGGHSVTDLLQELHDRGLARVEVRRHPTSDSPIVYYSRVRLPPPPAKRVDSKAAGAPSPPAAQQAGSKQLASDMPRGSSREALLVRAVAELDSKQPGNLWPSAVLGQVLYQLDSDWKARLGGHRLNDLVWELHRRGLLRAEEVTTEAGYRNLHLTNLRC